MLQINARPFRKLFCALAGIILSAGSLFSQTITISLVASAVPDSFLVRMQATSGSFTQIMNAQFTIRWPSTAGGTVNVPGIKGDCPTTYIMGDNGGEGVVTNPPLNPGFKYFTFQITGIASLGTTCPVTTAVATIGGFKMYGFTACMPANSINIVNDAYTGDPGVNKNYFVSIGGIDKTGAISGTGSTNGGPNGTPCSDSNPCTTGDTYNATCGCIGTPLPDTDGDGSVICSITATTPRTPPRRMTTSTASATPATLAII